jgi:hydroxymethylbilane synthase
MKIQQPLRIGTRDSQLAMWQAQKVQQELRSIGVASEIIGVKSEGDIDLVTPLYAMGVQGVFTKTLDAYLLSGKVDIVVHSLKDVPTQLAQGIIQGAVLKRANPKDVIVFHPDKGPTTEFKKIATGSVRRKSIWLSKYPACAVVDLRGNVQSRLSKLKNSDWDGAIFAAAGLERLGLDHLLVQPLDWMLSAPGQGAIMVALRNDDEALFQKIQQLNHYETVVCVEQERLFLSKLMGGCSTPISAYATIQNDRMHFQGALYSLDGTTQLTVQLEDGIDQANKLAEQAYLKLMHEGAGALVSEIKKGFH